jgi:hypothetical protein
LLLPLRKQRIRGVVTEAKLETLPARVVRYNVAMFRLGQTLIPLALLCTVVARHIPRPVTAVASIGLSVTCLGLFGLARRGLGRRTIHIGGGKLAFAGAELDISPAAVAHWRARKVALSVAVIGAFLVVLAFYFDLLPLALLGTPCAVLGLATLGALSQKVSGATIRD